MDWEFDQWRGGETPKFQQDRDDLNHELAGNATGKIARFGVGNHENSDHPEAKKKREDERAFRSMLQILLLEDAQYAEVYHRVQDKLDKAYQSVERVMSSIGHDLSKSQETLINFKNDATKLDDGTAVFQSLDGSIFTESGQRLSDEFAQNIAIKPGAPQWEEYRDVRDRYLDLSAQHDEVLRYKTEVLDHAAERMADHDDPPSREELDEISELIANVPASMKRDYESQFSTQKEEVNPHQYDEDGLNFDIPDLSDDFRNAMHNTAKVAPEPSETEQYKIASAKPLTL